VPERGQSAISLNAGTIASRAAGIMLAAATAGLVYDLPFAGFAVAGVLIACGALQIRFRDAWLITLPALLPIFDLTLWSGRLYVNEFDLLVLTTAAVHFLTAPARQQFPRFTKLGGVIVVLLLLSFTASMFIGAWPLPSPDANELGSYLSNYNALRVAKGIFWALLLLAPLQMRLSEDSAKSSAMFMVGVSIGLAFLGLVVLWERGVFLAIAQASGLYASRYAILGALLDFTWEYRATGLFSELHTGGEAIDTYLALAPPIAAAAALALRHPLLRLLCLGALGLGMYAVVATFSRGLYLGFASGIATVFVLAVLRRSAVLRGRFAALRAGAAVGLAFVALFAAYAHGGFTALGYGLALVGISLAAAHFVGSRSWWVASPLLIALAVIGCYSLTQAFMSSRYNVTDVSAAWSWATILSVMLALAAALVGGGTVPPERRTGAITVFVLLAIISVIGIPATGGYRMVERFSTASEDAHTRWEHWAESLRLMSPEWKGRLFGMGLGSFPRLHFRRGIESETTVSYRYSRDGSRTWLELGAGDFNLTQKIPLRPETEYDLTLATRADEANARLYVKLCPKLILYSDRYTPGCPEFAFKSEPAGEWVTHSVKLNSGALGKDAPFAWPITLMLHNERDSPLIDITDIQLNDGQRNIVANGSFAAGGDRWLMISDFEHLAWHIKNLYLEVFFETGAVGLAIFLLAFLIALANAIRAARRRLPIGIAISGALVAFAVVGATGSLLDNPRPASLFFVVLFWALQLAPDLAFQEQPGTATTRRRGQRRLSTHLQRGGTTAVTPVGALVGCA